ncbi:E3 ubiquitin-protein ligase CHIP [Halotydeus destructor]|nr:E3 ubiquitin-protein ligase CHIP [Halotydeus destructor]
MKPELNASELKDQGNRYYNHHKFEDAISCYSLAIQRNPTVPTFFTNRALCYLKMQLWEKSVQDCRRALDNEPNLIKGHFFMGQGLIELGLFDDAMKHLQRAQDLAKEQKLNFGDEIASQLRLARKKKWNLIEEQRLNEEIELQTYINGLILKDRKEQLEKIQLEEIADEEKHEYEQGVLTTTENYMGQLDNLFSAIDIRRKKREVPDYLCGKISFEIMRDPVVTPSGITYDRRDIMEHLQRVGHFDPVTRQPLTSDKLVPNLAMKEVVDTFLAENEWAAEY